MEGRNVVPSLHSICMMRRSYSFLVSNMGMWLLLLLLSVGSGGVWGQTLLPSAGPGGENTIVTGVVLMGGSVDVMCDLEVVIRCKDTLLLKTVARYGLIHADLVGLAEPGDWVEITVMPKRFVNEYGHQVNIFGAVISVRLANAQNMPVAVPSDGASKDDTKKYVRTIRIEDSGEAVWGSLRGRDAVWALRD
jgi:hypothetical protein